LSQPSILLSLLSLMGVAAVFLLYPLALWVRGLFHRTQPVIRSEKLPFATILVVVRNGADLVPEKIANCRSLDYPAEKLDILFFSDGSTDGTEALIRDCADAGIRLLASTEHIGKNEAINRSVPLCEGDVIVFSDTDALLETDALRRLNAHFSDPKVGGVCGSRRVNREGARLKSAQKRFIAFDSAVKRLESRLGWLTSNDGKLYAIRRELFRPLAEGTTDDLFTCLSVARQGYGFVFEEGASVGIRLPSRDGRHEVTRRRRIVSGSLRGIFIHWRLLNPFQYGLFSLGLLINKIFRRLLPFFLIGLFVGSAVAARENAWFALLTATQVGFYALAALHPPLGRFPLGARPIERLAGLSFYFVVGNYGTLLGVLDALRGRRITGWDPSKSG
jgi:biofilm PGA synthesis N-glycosyltransferase PgaC